MVAVTVAGKIGLKVNGAHCSFELSAGCCAKMHKRKQAAIHDCWHVLICSRTEILVEQRFVYQVITVVQLGPRYGEGSNETSLWSKQRNLLSYDKVSNGCSNFVTWDISPVFSFFFN